MKSTTLRVLMLLLVLCATVTSTACRVRQTEEGELPEVDVDGMHRVPLVLQPAQNHRSIETTRISEYA